MLTRNSIEFANRRAATLSLRRHWNGKPGTYLVRAVEWQTKNHVARQSRKVAEALLIDTTPAIENLLTPCASSSGFPQWIMKVDSL